MPEADDERLRLLASELLAWGGERAVLAWLDVLDRVQEAEVTLLPAEGRLVMAVASNLFKLMAYKDEYEVARLMTDAEAMAEARKWAGSEGRIRWALHPPLLRALGLRRKIRFATWTAPFFRLLARARFLRGTFFDPFGHTELRRLERALPAEYIAAIDRMLPKLESIGLELALSLAELPDQVRGYEELKLERIAAYREALETIEALLEGGKADE